MVKEERFGLLDGQPVALLTITDGAMEVELISFGAAVRSIRVPDRNGNTVDVCLGYDTPAEYRDQGGCLGGCLGRCANRIGGAKFTLNGVTYPLFANEGANTLDDTRDALDMELPRHRIDCATWAIMGMGMGSAVGAAVSTRKSVVAIEGDSAFGFSGMDFSTICRFNLPVTVVIFNNGGIYNGIGVNLSKDGDPAPTTLDIKARYDKLGECFGADNYYVTTPEELTEALTKSIASKRPTLIDVQLAADSGKESGHIGYLNPAPLQNIVV